MTIPRMRPILCRRLLCLAFLPLVAAVIHSGASAAEKKSQPLELDIAASTTTWHLARALQTVLGEQGLILRIHSVGSERAIDEVRSGQAEAGLIARPLSPAEAGEFQATKLAMDSLLLIVNERNPLQFADTELIRRIFAREFSDWQQVNAGGKGPIAPVTRRATDGSRTVFDSAFRIGRIIPTGIVELGSNLAAVLYVAADPQAIGYVSAESFDDAKRRGLRIRAIALDGQAPAAGACDPAHYPLCRPIVLIRKSGKSGKAYQQFENFLRSGEGRSLIEQHGFSTRDNP